MHQNEEQGKWEIGKKKHHRKNKTDFKEKCETVTKKCRRKNTTDDKANESPSDATNPIEKKNDDDGIDGIDIDDDTKNTTNERHSERKSNDICNED